MSDASAIFLMLGIFVAALAGGAYVTKLANDRMDGILTGVTNGAAVRTKHRTVMLYNQWLPMMSTLAGASLVAGLGYFEVARLVSGRGAQFIAYVLVGWWGWSFLMNLFLGASTLLNCLSVLRQAEAD
jgi:hypothetical protein